MSFVKINVHAVWGTKLRRSVLKPDILDSVCSHIKQNAKSKNIWIDTINGYDDHLHCLAELHKELSICKQMQLIKGESSHWINKNNFFPFNFSWAEDFYAVSVSEKDLDAVRMYINNQQEHHSKMSFQEECEQLKIRFRLLEG